MLASLPDQFCLRVVGAKRGSPNCWNGADNAGYGKPASIFTLDDQKCNPEIAAEALPCEPKKSVHCDRADYLVTRYAETPSLEPPGRSRAAALTASYVLVLVVGGGFQQGEFG